MSFELLKILTNIMLEIYAGEEYPKVIFTNFLKPVITTWWTRGLVVREISLDT
jgi:hypothetical protein